MRFLFRWAFRLTILLLVLAIGLFVAKDGLAKWWLVNQFRNNGLDARVESLEIGFPFNSTVALTGFTLYNPAEFGSGILLKLDDLFLECEVGEFWKLRPQFTQARIRVKELRMVDAGNGDCNIASIPDVLSTPTASKKVEDYPLLFTIDTLNFSWERLKFINLKNPSKNRDLNLNIEEHTSKKIKTVGDLKPLIRTISLKIGLKILLQKLFGPILVNDDSS